MVAMRNESRARIEMLCDRAATRFYETRAHLAPANFCPRGSEQVTAFTRMLDSTGTATFLSRRAADESIDRTLTSFYCSKGMLEARIAVQLCRHRDGLRMRENYSSCEGSCIHL
jgi:hypothetical protein